MEQNKVNTGHYFPHSNVERKGKIYYRNLVGSLG